MENSYLNKNSYFADITLTNSTPNSEGMCSPNLWFWGSCHKYGPYAVVNHFAFVYLVPNVFTSNKFVTLQQCHYAINGHSIPRGGITSNAFVAPFIVLRMSLFCSEIDHPATHLVSKSAILPVIIALTTCLAMTGLLSGTKTPVPPANIGKATQYLAFYDFLTFPGKIRENTLAINGELCESVTSSRDVHSRLANFVQNLYCTIFINTVQHVITHSRRQLWKLWMSSLVATTIMLNHNGF